MALPKPQGQINGTYSLFSYKDKRVQALIWELKYHRNSKAIGIVGKILAENVLEELSDRVMFENMSAVLLVTIPMTTKRLRERKFSQTDLICKEMMKYLPNDISYMPQALKKIRETEKQSRSKSRQERLRNLYGAFFADSKIVAGKSIILIDDVTTTGATVAEATRALKFAGAKNILIFTVAH